IPLRHIWLNNVYQTEQQNLQTRQDAILGYAMAHQTSARVINVVGAGGSSTAHSLPAGRPYLPCPDVDGDGYEDRGGMARFGILPDVSYDITPTSNPLLTQGNCALSRGIFPWKTLGLPGADTWGNRYTYQVDDLFSNAIMGFNQDSIADSFDVRLTVSASQYQRRVDNVTVSLTIGAIEYGYTNKRNPIVVCNGSAIAGDICQSGLNLALQAGIMATVDFTASRRNYLQNDVVEGVVYAIVSHGKNGYGAVNHLVNNDPTAGIRCNFPVNSSAAVTLDINLQHEAVHFPFLDSVLPSALSSCADVSIGNVITNGFFVAQPRGRGNFSVTPAVTPTEYDDVLVWATRQDIFQQLAEGQLLPAPETPVFRSY
nr:hypothetical protein [Pseudomonadota bacterium]